MGELPLPVEIIFSCAVCQATISEIYQNPEGDKGFRDGVHASIEQSITKLWLTECAHLTCGKHLEGGGAPFHRPDEPPRAPCPICSTERNDSEQKALYGIRGCLDGSFNERIPKNWFDTPPIKLDGSGKGMDAMRFHYLSLVRFGTNMLANFRKVQATVERLEKKNSDDDGTLRNLHSQVEMLRTRVAELEECEKALKPWKERGPKIKYYLGVFEEVTRENEKLREQLSAMGYAVPSRRVSFERAAESNNKDAQELGHYLAHGDQYIERSEGQSRDTLRHAPEVDHAAQGGSSSSRTLTGPTIPMEPIVNLSTDNTSLLSNKRKRNDDEDNVVLPLSKSPRYVRGESRYLMPPPPLPLTRAKRDDAQLRRASPQIMHHTVDQSADHVGEVQPVAGAQNADLQILEDEVWQPVTGPRRLSHPVTMNTYRQPTSASSLRPREEQHTMDYRDQENKFGEDREFIEAPELEVIDRIYNRLPVNEQYSYQQNLRPSHEVRKSRRLHEPYLTQYEYNNPATQLHDNPDEQRGKREQYLYSSDRQGPTSRSTNREPLRMYSESALNRQATHPPHDLPVNSKREHANPPSSPWRNKRLIPTTPLPQGQFGSAFMHKESVTSPFFRRNGAVQYSGPVRIPERQQPRPSIKARNFTQNYGMQSPSSASIEPAHGGLKNLSSRANPRETLSHRPIYTPAPYNSSQPFLAPSTPRDSHGLFRRPDGLSVPSSPYFNRSQFPSHAPISARPNHFAKPIAPLPPITPSFRPSLYPPMQKPAHALASRSNAAFTTPAFGGSGSRSGVSRPSREWARNSSDLQLNDLIGKDKRVGKNDSYSTRSGMRSVRR